MIFSNSQFARRSWLTVLGLCLVILGAADIRQIRADENRSAPQFEQDIVPILKAYCWKCHGGEGRVAGLDTRTLPLLLKGGKSGPALKRGSSAESLLFQKLSQEKMPPEGALRPTAEHLELIRNWLDSGAPAQYAETDVAATPAASEADRAFWAFRPPVRVPVPAVKNPERIRAPLDAFLLAKLDTAGLDFAPQADRRVLIRRAYFDLIGLPPEPDVVETFLADPASDGEAFRKLVERLLASTHYGERWGRHWLDAAGYVDTIGSDNDAGIIEEREGIWRYRDWVVRSLNADKPYDRFLLEQLAGDELTDWRTAEHLTSEAQDLLIATGFLRQASDVTYAPELNTADIRHQVLYDTLQIFSTNVLGLTLHCCQCHDHKFDPLPQQDYFRMAAVFAPAYDPQNWKHSKERFLFDVSAADKLAIDDHNTRIDQQIAALRQQESQTRQPFAEHLIEQKLKPIPEVLRADLRAAVAAPADKRSEIQKYLATKLGGVIAVSTAEIDAILDDGARTALVDLGRRITEAAAGKKAYGKIQALWEVASAPPSFLYRRGDYTTPGESVQPAVIGILNPPGQPTGLAATPDRPTTGYRTGLAQWLTRSQHPLTARVIVNRVWQQYFGRGIVATPDNFGLSGAQPSHPELLDFLAVEFMEHGWSLKWLHRQIVHSAAYQQASARTAAAPLSGADPRQVDPENKLLWRMPSRRLESELIRDALLATSGALDRSAGGPPVPLKSNPDGSVEIDATKCPTPTSRFRRSLYVFCRRNYQLSELSVFDQPAVAHNCTLRTNAAVVLQSLSMLNGKFALEMAERLADRVQNLAGETEGQRIDVVFRLVLSRPPTAEEVKLCAAHLERQRARYREAGGLSPVAADRAALSDLCQMLLNTNEFLYVE